MCIKKTNKKTFGKNFELSETTQEEKILNY